jgi:hypothetical protein
VRRRLVWLTLVALAAGCGPVGAPVPSVAGGGDPGVEVPRCEDVLPAQPPAELLRDTPIYVANEQPVEELQAWAESRPGFEELWIDREHLGWVVLGFSEDADARQAELTAAFPEVGAVVVPVERTLDELLALQREVHEQLEGISGSWASVAQGVVGVELGALTDEKLRTVSVAFGDRPVCVSGTDPAELPAAGPQAPSGPGWRLLVDELGGDVYRTGIAADPAGLERLRAEIGLDTPLPEVDLASEVVVWFGAVYSSSCPELRFDGVRVVEGDPPIVHAEIVETGGHDACTDDANPRAYVVAVARTSLPEGPFVLQLGPDDPPPGAPGERTVVDADLRQPGAALPADRAGPDPASAGPAQHAVGPGDIIEPGYPIAFRFELHCGPEWLGPLNDVLWRSETADTPAAWRSLVDPVTEVAVVEVLLETDPPTLTATAGGHGVVYEPTAEEHPGCD